MGGPSAQELLAHAGFVRRVAEGMLSDAHDVDDVVQETYLAALRRPPASGLRAWLGAVARNAARMRLRGARRRVFHERVGARPEAAAAAGDAAARMEIHRRLVDEVLALEEPTRTIIVLRYLDGIPPRAIAGRLRLPIDTVRSRLRRGLDRLRGRLDAWSGGDRVAWALVLLPAVREGKRAALFTGGAIVGKKTAAVLALWAIAASGLYLHELTRPRAPAPRAAGEAAPPALLPEAAPARKLTATEEREEFQRRWLGSRTGTVRGVVRDHESGKPVSARVHLKLNGTLPDGTTVAYETVTNSDGAFSLPDLRYPLDYEVACSADAEGIDAKVVITVTDGDVPVAVTIRLDLLVVGEVVDASGRPVPGATVFHGHGRLRDGITQADASGRFRLKLRDRPTEDAAATVAAVAPGFQPGWADLRQSTDHLWNARATLEPGPLVRARVLRPDGSTAGDTEVFLQVERTYQAGERPPHPDPRLFDLVTGGGVGIGKVADTVEEHTSLGFKTDAGGRVECWLPFVSQKAWLVAGRWNAHRSWREVEGLAGNPLGTFDLGEFRLSVPPDPLFIRFIDARGNALKGLKLQIIDFAAPAQFLKNACAVETDDLGRARLVNVTIGRRYTAHGMDAASASFQPAEFVAEPDGVVTLR